MHHIAVVCSEGDLGAVEKPKTDPSQEPWGDEAMIEVEFRTQTRTMGDDGLDIYATIRQREDLISASSI
jgi:hypothetical protein